MKTVTFLSVSDTKKVWRLVGLLFLLGAISTVFVSFHIGHRLVMQLMMFGSLTAAVYFWLAYIATTYLYEVGEENGQIFFLVYKKQGKKSIMQVKLPLSAIDGLVKTDATHALSPAQYDKKYRYSSAFFPEGYDVLFFKDDGATVAIEISADEAFLSLFSAALAEKKSTIGFEEDEEDEEDEEYEASESGTEE